jgi:hypothetical protein
MTRHGDDPVRVWPVGEHDPLTPMGEIEQAGMLAGGLRHNPKGVRRAGWMLLALVVVLALVGTLVTVLG